MNKQDIEKYLRMLGRELLQHQITLASDWINDAVKGFFYAQPPTEQWAEFPGLRVFIPSLDYLLVMKVVAGRPQDIEDIKAIAHELHLTNPQAALNMVKQYVPEQLLVPRIEYMIDEIFE